MPSLTTMEVHVLFEMIAKKWAVNDSFPQDADLIAVISYAATQKRLTNGSREVALPALNIAEMYPYALIGWGFFSKNPDLNIERIEKEKIFPRSRSVFVGGVSSTTDECKAIKLAILARKKDTRNIIVVAEGSHSRRDKLVWKHYFPYAEIYFRSVPAQKAADPENPMWMQRYWRIWLAANICVHPLYTGEGVKRMAAVNFSQPAS